MSKCHGVVSVRCVIRNLDGLIEREAVCSRSMLGLVRGLDRGERLCLSSH
jgi:hypothetical protein